MILQVLADVMSSMQMHMAMVNFGHAVVHLELVDRDRTGTDNRNGACDGT